MIFYQNCGVIGSFLFYLIAKLFSVLKCYNLMYKKRVTTLDSIPEIDVERKWVPKKKHEVLKAKYKCLKKLFQIYDASLIGILPEPGHQDTELIEETQRDPKKSKRKKRSNRTKTDASAGTTESYNCDVTEQSTSENGSTIATAVMRELKIIPQCCTSTQFDGTCISKYDAFATTQVSKENVISELEFGRTETVKQPILATQYNIINEQPKLTRFQWFIQRIFGTRHDKSFPNYGHIYAASDNNIIHQSGERRRRRGLRFRSLRKPKKVQSESALRRIKSPAILTYIQSVQRNCLMDTTSRQCPIVGCKMMFYGIINYNDHLNLCHFPDRKYICSYCHDGFEREDDKYAHENDHIGINKLNLTSAYLTDKQSGKNTNITQKDTELTKTNVAEEKLKKIVSFFDKIKDGDHVISQIKTEKFSESNFQSHRSNMDTTTDKLARRINNSDGDKRTVSCGNLSRKNKNFNKFVSSTESDMSSKYPFGAVTCNFCGDQFEFRRQLSLHMDLEHRFHDKYSKFHSCAGLTDAKRCQQLPQVSKINTQTKQKDSLSCTILNQDGSSRQSEGTLSCEPSTNIVYYTSSAAVKPSRVDFVNKGGYKWCPVRK